MDQRYESNPREVEMMNTNDLRENFLIEGLFQQDEANFLYSHYDRMVVGGVSPKSSLELPHYDQLRSSYFLERREMGIINIGAAGKIEADGTVYEMETLSCLYLGKGTQKVTFHSNSDAAGSKFYCFSAPAHADYPTTLSTKDQATPVTIGSSETSNERTIFKYIHPEGIKSCQVVMGLTLLKTGSVWNTMPPHTHDRRSEIYLYFDVPENQGVMHFMGEPSETRHLWVQNEDAVISPPWSIHAGSGTASYSFIWAMAGENQDFTDMDFLELTEIR